MTQPEAIAALQHVTNVALSAGVNYQTHQVTMAQAKRLEDLINEHFRVPENVEQISGRTDPVT